MFASAVIAGLNSVGINVVDIGMVPTPTVEIAVTGLKAAGGICITASHNPAEWNALKFFNATGEFITPAQYRQLDRILTSNRFAHKSFSGLGRVTKQQGWVEKHADMVLKLKEVNRPAVRRRKMKVVIDAVNGAGSKALPLLLEKLGVEVVELNCEGDGRFVHEPEPIPKNLGSLCRAVKKHKADLGMACDPDADRLALVDEKGRPIGEELTLTVAVKEILTKSKGPVVINLSTSKTTADIARAAGSRLYYSKVGEANVVEMIHRRKATIGGEGNGGVIFPACHAGRDASVAAALVLTCLARERKSLSSLVETLPTYYNIKTKAALPNDFTRRLKRFEKDAEKFVGSTKVDRRDGLRFDFQQGWVQIRSSNTEPIFRLIIETDSEALTARLLKDVKRFFK
jgi:phosphomannomutase